ncbi:MAG: clan AA aspartic protease [Candidatus Bathyarchaeota archaeon]|nr:MAG: clan AA aspartic protease [Candidatus Bathyarchaeota archaeon]
MRFYIANPERPIITLKATVNEKGPFDFVFDTGASVTVIEKQTAAKLGLSEKVGATREALGAGGALSSSMATDKSKKVGDVEARDLLVGVLDLSNLMKCSCLEEFGGIIGYNFVKDYRVTIDYPKQEIHFEKAIA